LIAGHDQAFGAGAITINGGRLGTEYGITFTNPIIFGANGGVLAGNGTFTQALTIGAGRGPGARILARHDDLLRPHAGGRRFLGI
jgi:hypothetical protein